MTWVSVGWVLIVGGNGCILESKTTSWIGDDIGETKEEWWVECKVLKEPWEGEEKDMNKSKWKNKERRWVSRNTRESAYNHKKTRLIKNNMMSDVNFIKGLIKTKIHFVRSVITDKKTFSRPIL